MKQKIKNSIEIVAASLFIFGFAIFAIANTANNPSFMDSDKDGLSDEEERVYGTDVNNADSDGDGYSDGTEVKSGYDPLKPAPGDKIISEKVQTSKNQQAMANKSLTEEFANDFKQFVSSKDKQAITVDDLDAFVDGTMADKVGAPVTKINLPEIDSSKIKVKKQDYSKLEEREKLEKEKKDWDEYLTGIFSIYVSNIPQQISSERDLSDFYKNFESKLAMIGTSRADYQYFRDLGSRLEKFSDEAQQLDVPESALHLHIGFLRIIKGFVALKDPSLPGIEDPLTKFIILSRVDNLKDISAEFFNDDFAEYQKKFESLK